MRGSWIVTIVAVGAALGGGAACGVWVPQPPALEISAKVRARVRAEVRVDAQGQVVPVAPVAPVPIVGAEVVEFFGIPLEGADEIVFVLDRSGSMQEAAHGPLAQVTGEAPPAPDGAAPPPDGAAPPPPAPPKIEVARRELIDALRRLPAGTRTNVIFFNEDLAAVAPAIVSLDEGMREGVIRFVEGIDARGSTALTPAMRIAFLLNARRIVLLSDGLGNVGGDGATLLRDAREAMRGGVRIDTIGLGRSQDARLLQQLADESGGLYQAL